MEGERCDAKLHMLRTARLIASTSFVIAVESVDDIIVREQ